MNLLRLLIFILFTLSTQVLAQQYTQTVRGRVLDRESQAPLPGAKIVLLDSTQFLGAVSDFDGYFVIKDVPVGRRTFRITMLGYEDAYINEVPVTTGKELSLNIEMIESLKELTTVEVTANKNEPINSMATVSTRVFSIDETSRYAGSFNDPARMAQSFAGVSNTGDRSNELVIRGNSSRGVLWRVEGVEVPNPNHFRSGDGSSGGGVSILSSNVLSNSDFLTGAFPAEYGNATSGVFDIKLRRGNIDKREYAFEFGPLGTEISLEGPFSRKSKSSYLVNYRYSTLDIISRLGMNLAGDIEPSYQDLTLNFVFPTKKAGTFTWFGMGGLSKALLAADRDTSLWETFADQWESVGKQTMGITGISHMIRLKDQKSYIKTVAVGTFASTRSTEGWLDSSYNYNEVQDEVFDYPVMRLSTLLNSKLNKKNTVRFGLIYSYTAYTLEKRDHDEILDSMITTLNSDGSTSSFQTYGQWKHRFGTRLESNIGYHFTYFLLNNKYAIDPRAGMRFKLSEKSALSLGAGLHSRLEAISIYLAKQYHTDGSFDQPNKNMEMMKAAHGVLGYEISLKKNLQFKTEVYYQYLYDVPIYDTISSVSVLNFSSGFTNQKMVSEGTGYNYGIEFTLEKYFADNWFFLTTLSLFDSRYTAGDGISRFTRFNSHYVSNLVAGKEFKLGKKKNNILSLNSRLIWKGGNRMSPINLDASIATGTTVYDDTKAFEQQLPYFLRWDLTLSYRINRPKFNIIFSADVQNVTNRLNVASLFFNPETGSIDTYNQFGILPIVKFKIQF